MIGSGAARQRVGRQGTPGTERRRSRQRGGPVERKTMCADVAVQVGQEGLRPTHYHGPGRGLESAPPAHSPLEVPVLALGPRLMRLAPLVLDLREGHRQVRRIGRRAVGGDRDRGDPRRPDRVLEQGNRGIRRPLGTGVAVDNLALPVERPVNVTEASGLGPWKDPGGAEGGASRASPAVRRQPSRSRSPPGAPGTRAVEPQARRPRPSGPRHGNSGAAPRAEAGGGNEAAAAARRVRSLSDATMVLRDAPTRIAAVAVSRLAGGSRGWRAGTHHARPSSLARARARRARMPRGSTAGTRPYPASGCVARQRPSPLGRAHDTGSTTDR